MSDCNFGTPASAEVEKFAQDFSRVFRQIYNGNDWGEGMVKTRRFAETALNEILKASHDDQYNALRRIQDLNDKSLCENNPAALPIINIVFGDLDGDGKKEELTKFSLSQRPNGRFAIEQEIYRK